MGRAMKKEDTGSHRDSVAGFVGPYPVPGSFARHVRYLQPIQVHLSLVP
jgi:hypothetical protein